MANLERRDVFGDGEFLPRLIEELEALYPQVFPSPSDTWEKVLYQSGQYSVVEYLKTKLDD